MLGIIDWGIGGISIYKLIKERLGPPVLYFSDTGATPYGKMRRIELAERLNRVISFLISKGASHIVIGCNAASTAIDDLGDHGIPVTGVIGPAVEMTTRSKPTRLGLIGGRRTIVSGVYRKALANREISVNQRIAQPLSGMIESGDVSSETLKFTAAQILKPIRNSSHILLACTHYPAILPLLRSLVSSSTKFIDPAAEMVNIVEKWQLYGQGESKFVTTGDANAMKLAAVRAFGVEIGSVSKVNI